MLGVTSISKAEMTELQTFAVQCRLFSPFRDRIIDLASKLRTNEDCENKLRQRLFVQALDETSASISWSIFNKSIGMRYDELALKIYSEGGQAVYAEYIDSLEQEEKNYEVRNWAQRVFAYNFSYKLERIEEVFSKAFGNTQTEEQAAIMKRIRDLKARQLLSLARVELANSNKITLFCERYFKWIRIAFPSLSFYCALNAMTYQDAKKFLEQEANDWVEFWEKTLAESYLPLLSVNNFYVAKKIMLSRYDTLLEYAIIHGEDEDAQNKIRACKEKIAKVYPEESKIKELLAEAKKDVFEHYSQAFEWVKDPRFSGFLSGQTDGEILLQSKLIKLCVEFTEHSDGSFSIFTPSYVKELRALDAKEQGALSDMIYKLALDKHSSNRCVKSLKLMEKSLLGMASHQKLREAITNTIDNFIMTHQFELRDMRKQEKQKLGISF